MTEIEKVQEWNRRHPVGATVEVSLDGGETRISTTRCEARLSGKAAVIWVKGIAGAYALDRVRVLGAEPGPEAPASPTPAPVARGPLDVATWATPAAMRFDVVPDPSASDTWRVEAIDRNGSEQFFLAIFRGPAAEVRAREYAGWKNARRG